MTKKSFLEKLTGAITFTENEDVEVEINSIDNELMQSDDEDIWEKEEIVDEGELSVDVYQTPSEIIVQTMVAGVRPEDLDISINRDMVTIRGKREESKTVNDENYFSRELYWGSFSRTILLPQEIEVEEAEAVEKHGLLIIKLPKLNKEKQAKIKVKSLK